MWTLWIFVILLASGITGGLNYLTCYPNNKSYNGQVSDAKRVLMAILVGMIPLTIGLFVSFGFIAGNFPCGK